MHKWVICRVHYAVLNGVRLFLMDTRRLGMVYKIPSI